MRLAVRAGRARVFVSPHAMARFRERIRWSCSDEAIIAILQAGIAEPHSVKVRALNDGTPSWTVRIKGQEVDGVTYSYRAVIVPAAVAGGWPVVSTVLPGSAR